MVKLTFSWFSLLRLLLLLFLGTIKTYQWPLSSGIQLFFGPGRAGSGPGSRPLSATTTTASRDRSLDRLGNTQDPGMLLLNNDQQQHISVPQNVGGCLVYCKQRQPITRPEDQDSLCAKFWFPRRLVVEEKRSEDKEQ